MEREQAPEGLPLVLGDRKRLRGCGGVQGKDEEQEPFTQATLLLLRPDTVQRVAHGEPDPSEEESTLGFIYREGQNIAYDCT